MSFPTIRNPHIPYQPNTGPLKEPAQIKQPAAEPTPVKETAIQDPKSRGTSPLRQADALGEEAEQAVFKGELNQDFIKDVPLSHEPDAEVPSVGDSAGSPEAPTTDPTQADPTQAEPPQDVSETTDSGDSGDSGEAVEPAESELDPDSESAVDEPPAAVTGGSDGSSESGLESAEGRSAVPVLSGRAGEIKDAMRLGMSDNPPLKHVDQKYVDFGRALKMVGVSEADIDAFLAADPDALLDEGKRKMLPQPIQDAYDSIKKTGSWPALNAITGLLDLQKSRLGNSDAEQKLSKEIGTLKGNLAIRRSRAGIGKGKETLAHAARLEAQAQRESDPDQKAELLKKARAERDTGIKRLEGEKQDQLRFVRLAEKQGRPPMKYYTDGVSQTAIGLSRGYLDQARSDRAQQPSSSEQGPDGLPALAPSAKLAQENLDLAIAVDGDLRVSPKQASYTDEVIQKNIELGEVLADVSKFRRETYTIEGPESPDLLQARTAETVRLAAITQDRIAWVGQSAPESFQGDRQATLLELGLEQEGYQKELTEQHLSLEATIKAYENQEDQLKRELRDTQDSASKLTRKLDKLKANPMFLLGFPSEDALTELIAKKAQLDAHVGVLSGALTQVSGERRQLAEQDKALKTAYRETQTSLREDPRLGYLAEPPGLYSNTIPERLLHQRDQNMDAIDALSEEILGSPTSTLSQKKQALDALSRVARFEAETSRISDQALDDFYHDGNDDAVRLKTPAARRENAIHAADRLMAHYQDLTAGHGFQPDAALDTVHAAAAVSRAVALDEPAKSLELLKASAQIANDDPTGELQPQLQKVVYSAATDNQRALFARQNLAKLCTFSQEKGLKADATPINDYRSFRLEMQAQVSDPELQGQIAADFATEDAARSKLSETLRAKAAQLRQGAREMAGFTAEWAKVYAERADDQVSDLGVGLIQGLTLGMGPDVGNLEERIVDLELHDLYSAAANQYLQARGLEQMAEALESATSEEYDQMVTDIRLREEDGDMENFIFHNFMDETQRDAYFAKPIGERDDLVYKWTRSTFNGLNQQLDALKAPEGPEDPQETFVMAKGLMVKPENVAGMSWYDDAAFQVFTINTDPQVGLREVFGMSEIDLAESQIDDSGRPLLTSKSVKEVQGEEQDYQAYHQKSQKYVDLNDAAYSLATLLPVGRALQGVSSLLRLGQASSAMQKVGWIAGAVDKGTRLTAQAADKLSKLQGILSSSRLGILAERSMLTLEGIGKQVIRNQSARSLALNVGKEAAFEQLISLAPKELAEALEWMGAISRTDANWKEALGGVTQVAIENWDAIPPELRSAFNALVGGATETWKPKKPHGPDGQTSPSQAGLPRQPQHTQVPGETKTPEPVKTPELAGEDLPAARGPAEPAASKPAQPSPSGQAPQPAGKPGISPQTWDYRAKDVVVHQRGEAFVITSTSPLTGKSLDAPYKTEQLDPADVTPSASKANPGGLGLQAKVCMDLPNGREVQIIGIQGDQIRISERDSANNVSERSLSRQEFDKELQGWVEAVLPPDQSVFLKSDSNTRLSYDPNSQQVVAETVRIVECPDLTSTNPIASDFPDVRPSDLAEGQVIRDKHGNVWQVDQIRPDQADWIVLTRKEQISGVDFLNRFESADFVIHTQDNRPGVQRYADSDAYSKHIREQDKQASLGQNEPARDTHLIRRVPDSAITQTLVDNTQALDYPHSDSKQVPSNEYLLEIDLGEGRSHKIKVLVPDQLPDGMSSKEAIKRVREAVQEMPAEYLHTLKEVRINPQPYKKDLPGEAPSYATAGNGIIDVYPSLLQPMMDIGSIMQPNPQQGLNIDRSRNVFRETMLHELAHLIADDLSQQGTFRVTAADRKRMSPDGNYEAALQADAALTGQAGHVTAYAKTDLREEFAETVAAYLESDGGMLNPALREKYPHRFRYLDNIFKANPDSGIQGLSPDTGTPGPKDVAPAQHENLIDDGPAPSKAGGVQLDSRSWRDANNDRVIQNRIGPAEKRVGFEKDMYPGIEVGLKGWDRAHSQGAGLGNESSRGILYAPMNFNRSDQANGIEAYIKNLFENKPADKDMVLTTVTTPHPGTLRLKSITYRVDMIPKGASLDSIKSQGSNTLFVVSLGVSNDRVNPRISREVDYVRPGFESP